MSATIEKIHFQNQNEAVAVHTTSTTTGEEVVRSLGLKPFKAIVLVLGGAGDVDKELVPRLTQLFGRGIARAAAEANAIVIDGGTQAGVIAMMGDGVAGRGYRSQLVGVAPRGKVALPGEPGTNVPLEPNHSHFVLVEGSEWGAETATIYNLISVLTSKESGLPERPVRKQAPEEPANRVPAVAILASGGSIARGEVLRAVRNNLPLIVIEGSGGLADEIAAAWNQRATLPDDPVMAEIVADGDVHLHSLHNPVKGVERLIIRELGVDKVLMEAWERFADYDLNAILQQKRFSWLQITIIVIGVAGTALAIIKQLYFSDDTKNPWASSILYHSLIIVPILLTVLITAASRFKQGNKWLLLRAGAESIKREIYSYRTRANDYKTEPEQHLALRVEDITRRTMRTDVNLSALVTYDKDKPFPPKMDAARGGDDGLSYLTPDRYVEVRLGDQLNYFKTKTVKLERQLKALYWLTFLVGGVGTYLAAVNQQVWIALTTAIVAAIGTYLGLRQTESTLTKYNQAATDLANVKTWWNALSAEEQAQQENIDSLVEHTEQVLQSELDGWVQQMQNALAELRKGPEASGEGKEGKADSSGKTGRGDGTTGKPGGKEAGSSSSRPRGEGTRDAGEGERTDSADRNTGGDAGAGAAGHARASSSSDTGRDNH